MTIRVAPLESAGEAAYEGVLRRAPDSLLYASLPYRAFLRRVLASAEDRYLVAFEDEEPAGVLPAFVQPNTRHGAVVNSLPFYGSNGGATIAGDARDPAAVRGALLDAFDGVVDEVSAVAATVISSPLADDARWYEERNAHTFRDERIGQMTSLPSGHHRDAVAELMASFHQKTRNAIRKAAKSDLEVRHSDSLDDMETLANLHHENITAVGGLPKPREVFTAIRETFAYERDYRVYSCELDGQIVASLLVFFHNRTAEYFTPATRAEFRTLQPMSLLVSEAMLEAVRRGCSNWNWGGTWPSQHGVYHFKSRWGTRDLPYYYFTRLLDERVLHLSRDDLLREYPSFFVVPFSELAEVAPVER